MESLLLEKNVTKEVYIEESQLEKIVFKYEFSEEGIFTIEFSDDALESIEGYPNIVACSCGGCKSQCKTTNRCSSPS